MEPRAEPPLAEEYWRAIVPEPEPEEEEPRCGPPPLGLALALHEDGGAFDEAELLPLGGGGGDRCGMPDRWGCGYPADGGGCWGPPPLVLLLLLLAGGGPPPPPDDEVTDPCCREGGGYPEPPLLTLAPFPGG